MADRLEMLSVEQLNSAVSLVNAITVHEKPNGAANVTSLSQGKTTLPSVAVTNNGPVVLSLNPKPSVISLPGTRSINHQNFIQSGNCMSLPVVAEDKSIIIGQPVQQIQTIPTLTSCQVTSVVTTPSNCIQQPPVQVQGNGLLQQTNAIPQSVSGCLISANYNGLRQTFLPTSANKLIVADDGTIQISNGATSAVQNHHIVSPKSQMVTFAGKTVCGIQQQQQPTVFLTPSGTNNSIPMLGNLAGSEQSTPLIFEVLPSSGTVVDSGASKTSTIAIPSVSTDVIQNATSMTVLTSKANQNAEIVNGQAKQVTSCNTYTSHSPAVMSNGTILLRKTLRKCPTGTVLEMVEKIQPASNLQTQTTVDEGASPVDGGNIYHDLVSSGSYCMECDKMYGEDDVECALHNEIITEICDTQISTRARMSLPCQLRLKQPSTSDDFQVGVFARDTIGKKTRFGPLIGQLQSRPDGEFKGDLPMKWKIFDKGKCTQVCDCSQEESSNWMCFVRQACTNEEQNVVAYQQGMDIWFIALKDILPDTELLYWYSNEYSALLGVRKKPGDRYKCGICGKKFQELPKVRSHITNSHSRPEVGKHQCQICSKSFPGKAKLNTHVLSHLGVKPFVCNTCGKQFTDQSNLRLHKEIHTGDKRFPCGQCGRAFRQKAHLVTHKLVHTKEKKMQCKYCPKTFARPSDLRSHEICVHTKDKKYICGFPNCQKVFYKLSVLKKHMLIHYNKKDFSCSTCNKTFITKYHMVRHAKACKGEGKGKKVKDLTDSATNPGEESSADNTGIS